jgi:hypothetical protein
MKKAAELGDVVAQGWTAEFVFTFSDWEKYYWLGRYVARQGIDISMSRAWIYAVLELVPSFERGENGRILHALDVLIKAALATVNARDWQTAFLSKGTIRKLKHVLELREAMLDRAKEAIGCWSVAGRRRGVVKDIRLMIAKMAWEPWLWSKKVRSQRKKAKRG